MFIVNSLDNMKFKFLPWNYAFHPNFSFEVSLLNKIYLSPNKHVKQLIENNKNLEVYNEIIGSEVSKIFEQKLLYKENETDTLMFFGKKNLMEILEEDIYIFKLFLEGKDYEKAFKKKIEREKEEEEEKKEEEEEKEEKKVTEETEEDNKYNNVDYWRAKENEEFDKYNNVCY